MVVWRQQDWVWRAAVVLNLAVSLSMLYYWNVVSKYWGWHGSDAPPANGPDADEVTAAVIAAAVIISCWLAMLSWRWGAWLWALVWVGLPVLATLRALPAAFHDVAYATWLEPLSFFFVLPLFTSMIEAWLRFSFLPAAMLASQVWAVWAAQLPAPEVKCVNTEVWRSAGVLWRVLWVVGLGVAGLYVGWFTLTTMPGVLSSLSSEPCELFTRVDLASEFVVLAGLSWLIVQFWKCGFSRPGGYLFWLLVWGLTLPRYVTILVHKLPGTSPECGEPMPVGWVSGLALLAISQVWVALKAREVQRQQAAGSEALEA